MTYEFEDDTSEISGTARIDVDVPALIASTGRSAGFINVVTESGWVTQNLPVLPGYPYPQVSTTLNLGSAFGGGIVSSLVAGVCYTAEPQVDPPAVTNEVFAVGATLAAGAGFIQPANAPAPPPPPVGAVAFQFPGVLAFAVQAGHSNVEAAWNQCGPAAGANGLDWLRATYGTAIPHANVLGLGPGPNGPGDNSLVGQMDKHMARTLTTRAVGLSVNLRQHVGGIMNYLWVNNLRNLTLRHQGNSGVAGDLTGAGNHNWPLGVANSLTSNGQGLIVRPDFIFDEVARGAAVEMDGLGARGGHAVTVIGAGRILGVPFVLYVSDHAQTLRRGGQFVNDNVGTGRIDFSFLLPQGNGQPLLRYGHSNNQRAVGVVTQSP